MEITSTYVLSILVRIVSNLGKHEKERDREREFNTELVPKASNNLKMTTASPLSDGEDSIGSWELGQTPILAGLAINSKRKSAFLPYKPNNNTVLTNLQRGNTEANVAGEISLSFHERCGQGEVTEDQVRQENALMGGVDTADAHQLTPLHWSCFYGQLQSVQLLIQFGAEVNRLAPDMVSPLLMAAAGGHHEVVRCLLQHGADVHHLDIEGNNALMFAAAGNHPHTSNELLVHHQNIASSNEHGDTAYSLAVRNQSYLAQSVLQNYLLSLFGVRET